MTFGIVDYALAAALAAVLAWAAWLGIDLHSVRGQLATANNTITQRDLRIALYDAADTANQSTIKALTAANADNRAAQAQAELSATAALARAQALRDQRDTAEAKSRQLTETIYANDPACAAWGDLPVCPGVARRLRERTGVQAGHPD